MAAPSTGWFRPVPCKPATAQEVRALLAARKLVLSRRIDMEMSLRGILRGFGLKIGPTDDAAELRGARVRLLMSAPGVGVIVALTYVAAVDDPGRFRSSKALGPHFGLTPKRYQPGETDVAGGSRRPGMPASGRRSTRPPT